jgi:hypothetical protein
MQFSLLQVDDFATDAVDVRAAVIAGGFSTETGPDGLPYTGISKYEVPHWHELIAQAMGRKIIPKLSCFRLNLQGELPHSWIHSDEICDAQYASVLYLNTPRQCKGGTAFWRHAGLGIDEMPPWEAHAERGIGGDWFLAMMNREWKDLTFWEQAGFVAMKWNRFITYPVSRFHSRYPFEGFGTGPEDGRLVWASFYSLGDTIERASLSESV